MYRSFPLKDPRAVEHGREGTQRWYSLRKEKENKKRKKVGDDASFSKEGGEWEAGACQLLSPESIPVGYRAPAKASGKEPLYVKSGLFKGLLLLLK